MGFRGDKPAGLGKGVMLIEIIGGFVSGFDGIVVGVCQGEADYAVHVGRVRFPAQPGIYGKVQGAARFQNVGPDDFDFTQGGVAFYKEAFLGGSVPGFFRNFIMQVEYDLFS